MTREDVLNAAKEFYMDFMKTGNHDKVVSVYNSIKPLPRGYKLQKKDAWCAAFVSAVGQTVGAGASWVYECSAPRMMVAWKERGLLRKDFDNMRPGDILFYDWSGNTGADHVGIVFTVDGKNVTVLEGNKGGRCEYRSLCLPYKYNLAYAAPKYQEVSTMNAPSSWAKTAWEKAVKTGLVDGTNPQGPLTREQMVVILDRLRLVK